MRTQPHANSGPLTQDELAAWRGFLRVHARLLSELDEELQRTEDLAVSAYEVLILLADAPERRMRISEISARTVLSLSGVSRLVDRLVRDGLVEKRPCPADRRGANAVLTEAGADRLRTARDTHRAGVRTRFLDPLSAGEIAVLGEVWRRLGSGEAEPGDATP
ncbi:MAG: MarR family transcriptional regulator [Thermoleophilia bacterium]|nr:MarR family transcriptional regulator [Thermoleophilia bacterium]